MRVNSEIFLFPTNFVLWLRLIKTIKSFTVTHIKKTNYYISFFRVAERKFTFLTSNYCIKTLTDTIFATRRMTIGDEQDGFGYKILSLHFFQISFSSHQLYFNLLCLFNSDLINTGANRRKKFYTICWLVYLD